jgi:hypothetical protein
VKTPGLEEFIAEKGEELKAELDPSKNKPNTERLAGVVVIGLRWFLAHALAELAAKKRQ